MNTANPVRSSCTSKRSRRGRLRRAALGVVTVCASLLAMACASHGEAQTARPALDRSASMTIYPTCVLGEPLPQVGETVGMMLERGGMEHLELSAAAFTPPTDAGLEPTTEAFRTFVKEAPPATDYALFNQFLGSPKTGVAEVRTIVVSRGGDVLWADRQTPDDADFARLKPRDPLDCCRLVVTRLRPVFALEDPFRKDAPSGKLSDAWKARTGLPTEAEIEAMQDRATICRTGAAKATLAVLQPRAAEGIETSAANLAARIDEAKLITTRAVAMTPALSRIRDMNEQKLLWTMARDFSAYVKQHPPDADYVLLADYLTSTTPEGALHVGAVHLALCDRQGELVFVEHQNRRQPDFKAIAPTSVADCDALAARRLERFLR